MVADFLAILTNHQPEIKWPNDLIIKQKKVAGLLIEKKLLNNKSYFLVGIGLNVLQQNFRNLPKAGSLFTQTGIEFDLEILAESLHQYLDDHLINPISEEVVLEELNRRLFRKNLISVFEIGQLRQNGIVKKVDEDGFLWVELEHNGLQKFFHKEITLLY